MAEARTILITGAELVRHFLSAGETVVASAFDEAPSATSLKALGEGLDADRLFPINTDIEQETSVAEISAFLEQNNLRPTSLVNAARNCGLEVPFLRDAAADEHTPVSGATLTGREQSVVRLFPEIINTRSQDLDPLYCPTGAIWLAAVEPFRQAGTSLGPDLRFEPIDWKSALDTDDAEDMEMAAAVASLAGIR